MTDARRPLTVRARLLTAGAVPITITDALPAGVTVSSLPSGTGWDCSATAVGSSTVSCTYTPSSALAPGTALPPLSVPTTVAPDARGPLTATATIASTDNANPAAAVTHSTVVHAAGRVSARHAHAAKASTRLVLVPLPPPEFTG